MHCDDSCIIVICGDVFVLLANYTTLWDPRVYRVQFSNFFLIFYSEVRYECSTAQKRCCNVDFTAARDATPCLVFEILLRRWQGGNAFSANVLLILLCAVLVQ